MIDLHTALRTPALNGYSTAKLLLLFVKPLFDDGRESPVKVRPTAEVLGLTPRTTRMALRRLVRLGLLEVVRPPSQGAAGTYRAGAGKKERRARAVRRELTTTPPTQPEVIAGL